VSRIFDRMNIKSLRRILVALDATGSDAMVMQYARSIAKAFGAHVRLIHVAAPPPDFVGYEAGPQYIRDVRAGELKHEHAALLRWRDELLADGIETDMRMVMGPTVETLAAAADEFPADLIIMGSHGRRGLARFFIGSVSDEVLKEHKWPLLVIPASTDEEGV